EPEGEIGVELAGAAGEAVGDAVPLAGVLGEDRREVLVRVALVQEHGLAERAREGELRVKSPPLRFGRRDVAVVVEPTLADRAPFRGGGELGGLSELVTAELTRVVRMPARGRKQPRGVRARESDGAGGAREARAGDDHLHDPGLRGACQHRLAVGVVALVREVDADVDEPGRGACHGGCVKVDHVTVILLNGDPLPRLPTRCLLALAAAALGALASGARADDAQWRDLENRIQYGYYTEDRRALQNLADNIARDESHGEWRAYYAGLVYWRLAQLAAQAPPGSKGPSVSQLAQRCTRELDATL